MLLKCNELGIISGFYGKRTALRSGVLLMNHIEEGDLILQTLGVRNAVRKAWMLHPVVQEDSALKSMRHTVTAYASADVVMLAMEYRSTANSWLSTMPRPENPLSPLPEVNQMLLADKVQNYKDFLEHHYGTHERSRELNTYFQDWLDVLRVTSVDLSRWFELIDTEKRKKC